MKDYQTHVFTCTYTADVSGVCSAMYELGGMTILHDPSGCNSTYSTHDEPRWFDGKSLMFVSGLDEMTAVLGDDSVIINDVAAAAKELKPKFITLCGGSIPHIIAFDFKGTAHLIENATGIPVIPVATDGLRSYVSGVGMALTEWIKRFADPALSHWTRNGKRKTYWSVQPGGQTEIPSSIAQPSGQTEIPSSLLLQGRQTEVSPGHVQQQHKEGFNLSSASESSKTFSDDYKFSINILGATPLDFSINGNIEAMKKFFENEGIRVNCCAAMGENFESMQKIYGGDVNVVVSSAGIRPARFMQRIAGIPRVEGIPIGPEESAALVKAVRKTYEDGKNRNVWEEHEPSENCFDGLPSDKGLGLDGQLAESSFDGLPSDKGLGFDGQLAESSFDGLPSDKGLGFDGQLAESSFDGLPSGLIHADSSSKNFFDGQPSDFPEEDRWTYPKDQILVIGEEIFAESLSDAINRLPAERRFQRRAFAMYPDVDEGLPEEQLINAMRQAHTVIADPLYRTVLPKCSQVNFENCHRQFPTHAKVNSENCQTQLSLNNKVNFIDFPHEAYSGRIYRKNMKLFCSPDFDVEKLLHHEE